MITYKEVLGMVKRAAPNYDISNPSVVRALRARQRILALRGQKDAAIEQALAKVPVETQEPSQQPAGNQNYNPDSYIQARRAERDAQSMKAYGKPWHKVQRAADLKFNEGRRRDALRDLHRGQADNRMISGNTNADYIYDKARQNANAYFDSQEKQIENRNYGNNPTWSQAQERWGSKAGAPTWTPQQLAYKNNLKKQLYSANMGSSNPEIARTAAQTAMMQQNPETANWGYAKAKELDLVPNSWQMPQGTNPQVAQRIVDSELAAEQEQPAVAQNEQIQHQMLHPNYDPNNPALDGPVQVSNNSTPKVPAAPTPQQNPQVAQQAPMPKSTLNTGATIDYDQTGVLRTNNGPTTKPTPAATPNMQQLDPKTYAMQNSQQSPVMGFQQGQQIAAARRVPAGGLINGIPANEAIKSNRTTSAATAPAVTGNTTRRSYRTPQYAASGRFTPRTFSYKTPSKAFSFNRKSGVRSLTI